jgi:hypothetical protein
MIISLTIFIHIIIPLNFQQLLFLLVMFGLLIELLEIEHVLEIFSVYLLILRHIRGVL